MKRTWKLIGVLAIAFLATAGLAVDAAMCLGCATVRLPDSTSCEICLGDTGNATGCIETFPPCSTSCAEVFPGHCTP